MFDSSDDIYLRIDINDLDDLSFEVCHLLHCYWMWLGNTLTAEEKGVLKRAYSIIRTKLLERGKRGG